MAMDRFKEEIALSLITVNDLELWCKRVNSKKRFSYIHTYEPLEITQIENFHKEDKQEQELLIAPRSLSLITSVVQCSEGRVGAEGCRLGFLVFRNV